MGIIRGPQKWLVSFGVPLQTTKQGVPSKKGHPPTLYLVRAIRGAKAHAGPRVRTFRWLSLTKISCKTAVARSKRKKQQAGFKQGHAEENRVFLVGPPQKIKNNKKKTRTHQVSKKRAPIACPSGWPHLGTHLPPKGWICGIFLKDDPSPITNKRRHVAKMAFPAPKKWKHRINIAEAE